MPPLSPVSGCRPAQYNMEYWEPSFYFVVAGTFGFFYLSKYHIPNTSIKDWAHDEAAVRLQRRADGLPVEFGVHYATKMRLGVTDEEDSE
jgi:hypothetical protein